MTTRGYIQRAYKIAILLALSTGGSSSSYSQVTATFKVTATVAQACTVSATDLIFGSYSLTQLDATSTISVQCAANTPFSIGLDPGQSGGGTVTNRAMASGASRLAYSLFRDNNRTLNWGQAPGDTVVVPQASGNLDPYTVYGRIASGVGVPTGSYSDAITVIVNY